MSSRERFGATQPWAAASMSMVMCAPSSVRDGRDQGVARRLGVDVGRQAQRELERGRRPQHVAAVARLGQPVGAGHLEGGPPGARREPLHRVGRQQLEPVDHRRRAVGELGRDGPQVVQVGVGDARALELGQQDAAGRLVLDPRQDAAQDAERRRHDAAALAAVDALGEDVDRDGDHQVPPQRRGEPEAVVAEPARVEADDEARRPDASLAGARGTPPGRGCRSPRSPR